MVVHLADGGGNPLSGTAVAISIQGSTVALNGTLTVPTDGNGNAVFSDLSINITGTYHLIAISGSLTAVSNTFTISARRSALIISVYEGDGQSTATGTPFSAPLKALVVDALGNPLSGAQVTFTAPSSGPGVTFAGSTTATTDASGIATAPAMTANSQTGAFQVSATTPNAASPAIFNLTNTSEARATS